ncbi:helix-turn-helix transcriptional regulator [Paenibacillus typhae]|uniref:Predicted DNA-binding transcriptional regulator YafY, contains an HTH and WYL domains n=1 Tax=Paenibacillus typhae TaxID=1174501 RepID=A0A1G8TNI0_9BACL|nr:hypothetical protein [Paenibacillus typhae]SDJ43111.1 Predicted DNA-binding transcriptional regulator YafY, contains an HTH and WYL domains [Paenibacillus typhae]
MSHTHRIQWFDQQVRTGRYPNSRTLAGQFEISKRQAQRDIEYMASSLCAPLQYVARERGYCYEDDSFMLPYLYMTDQEKQILKYLAYRYSKYNYENGPEVRRIGNLLGRLTGQQELEREARLPLFAVNPRSLQMFELLDHAIRSRITVKLIYDGTDGELELCPLRLENHYDADHLIARPADQQAGQPRYYLLSSILQLQLTGQHFADGPAPGSRLETGRRLKPFTARLRLSAPPPDGHWYGFPARLHRGDLYEVDFLDTELFIRHLLMTDWLELTGPKWLQDKVTARCRTVLHLLNPEEPNS